MTWIRNTPRSSKLLEKCFQSLWEAETVPDHVPVFLVLWDLSVFLSKFQLEDLLAILCTCPIPVCVPEGPVTYVRDKRTLDFDYGDWTAAGGRTRLL
ncbi:uncharacterized protein LOC144920607 isoform X2 [Branchiostoma floridae x Branchiostoma belcheri]